MFKGLLATWRTLFHRVGTKTISIVPKEVHETAAIQAGLHVAKRFRNRKPRRGFSRSRWLKVQSRRRMQRESRRRNRT